MELGDSVADALADKVSLSLTTDQRKHLAKDLRQLVRWIGQLEQVDTTHVASQRTLSVEVNVFAEAGPRDPMPLSRVLCNAPEHDGAYFCVPGLAKREA